MESRSVVEMLAFHAEERRDAMLTYVIDLYAKDLENFQMPFLWIRRILIGPDITLWRDGIQTPTATKTDN